MNSPKISLIAALSENRVIGVGNKLPWHISQDLKRFKTITSGHPVIMGRKTYESMGRLLPNRTNIIITRDMNSKVEGAVVVHSLEKALHGASDVIANEMKQSQTSEIATGTSSPAMKDFEIFIIGGGQIFEQALAIADKLYLTLVHTTIEGDAFFPDYSQFSHEVSRQDGEENGIKFTFLELEK